MADEQFDCLLQHSRKFFIEDKIINYIDETGDYMETIFFISKNTSVTSKQLKNEVIGHACEILQRDILTVVTDTRKANEIELVLLDEKNETDAFHILFVSPDKVKVCAETPLGLMYGVLEISHKILGVQPFWYFMEIHPIKKPFIEWTGFDLTLPDFATDYRGWFVNDELLLDQWEDNGSNEYVWERIYETLLRLGGNVIIPGTDKNSHRHRESAQAMGLIYTHHHAEPLGAEMFARRYPGLKASYEEHFALFKELWKKALHEQKGTNVIYTLGFRGQGDCPFWAEDLDRQWSAAEKAAVINEIVHLQYHMVKEVDPHAVCSMNIYGEMTELFNLGLLELPDDVIEIWADNGYGKMVSRRQGNHDPRDEVLTNTSKPNQSRGIYYHVAFHDLQASNFLTILPNSPEFVSRELMAVREVKMDKFVLVNTGNIKPHILFLQEIANFWRADYQLRTNQEIMSEHVTQYYQNQQEEIQAVYEAYFEAVIRYGTHEDQTAGDEFACYLIRKIIQSWLKQETKIPRIEWLTGDRKIKEQVTEIFSMVGEKIAAWENLLLRCQQITLSLQDKHAQNARFFNDIYLSVAVQCKTLKALLHLLDAYQMLDREEMVFVFVKVFDALEEIHQLIQILKENPSDTWYDFYENDGYTNLTLTKEMIKSLLSYIRIIGDGPDQDQWERKYIMDPTESRVMLLSNTKKALTDEKLARKIRVCFRKIPK